MSRSGIDSIASRSESFIAALAPGQLRHLFDRLPGLMMFAKDTRFRIVMGNPLFVARCGFDREDQLIGRTDDELFPPHLAAKYRADDEHILRSAEPMHDLIELFPNQHGTPEWSITDKLPLFDRRGRVVGIAGTVRSYEGQRAALQPYLELAEVAEHMKRSFREPLGVDDLAAKVGLSARQFGRKFQATFRMSPRAYQMRLRILHACELLKTTDLPVTRIALEAGFYDHADFARNFRRQMGVTAREWRRTTRSG